MVGGNFQIYVAYITEKCICNSKNRIRQFYTCSLGKVLPLDLFISPQPGREKLPNHPQKAFLQNLVPHQNRGGLTSDKWQYSLLSLTH